MVEIETNMMSYEQRTITIKMLADGGGVADVPREATVALGTGLAYLQHKDEKGEITYSVTHLKSGLDLCQDWAADSEEEVRAWIAGLVEIADWTEYMPRPTGPLVKIMRYAIVGALHDLPSSGTGLCSDQHTLAEDGKKEGNKPAKKERADV